ncbi:MAG TPA: DegT/DnrJ/EryC1/StrS family aminotransferase [Blastocatellia bacterium]|nr:DegT/DnrJ/EryC1/StrS family aminotransferase [Blastocatellia bacterium]
MRVPFGDLARQYQLIRTEVDGAIARVLRKGWFILGEEVSAFERDFAAYLGCRNVVGVASGTDALHLALVAAGVRPGDEVITAANTCVPTASGITSAGATVVLADVDPLTFTIQPADIERAITPRTRAIVPVHLYGQAADMDPIIEISNRKGIPVVEDAAQAHGATYRGKKLGTIGDAGCFSFYPSKNLGAFGDAGAVATDNDDLAAKLRQLRNYGERQRYFHQTKGVNSRLDEIQAAILSSKLPHLDTWNLRRRQIARFYDSEITNPVVSKPTEQSYGQHNYHLYVLRCSSRGDLQRHLADRGVSTLIHYPVPLHLQEAYADLGLGPGAYGVSEQLAHEVLSLPIFPELTDDEVRHVADGVNSFV